MDFNIDFDPYEVLGVAKDATQAQIRTAYAKKAKVNHPDQHQESEAKRHAENEYMKIAKAFEILGNEKSRKMYDTRGNYEGANIDAEELSKYFQGNPIFGNLFGGGRGQSGGGRSGFSFTNSGGPTAFFNMGGQGGGGMPGGFEDLFGGGSFGGQGNVRGQQTKKRSAAAAPEKKPKAPTQYKDVELSLEKLYTGTEVTQSINSHHLTLPVKAGLKPQSRITFEGKGQYDPSKNSPGDLVFIIKAKRHPTFHLEDRDLHMDLSVTLKDALEQRQRVFEVIAIDNSKHSILVGENEIIKDGMQKTIQGKGLPATKHGNKSGDLIVTFRIKLPDMTPDQRNRIVNIL
ncbi:MAG: hypothetical protein MHMPM18_000607 [Marteilia pararefringens]